MTDILIQELTLEDNTIENLFKNGDCLTFNPYDSQVVFKYANHETGDYPWSYADKISKEYWQKHNCEPLKVIVKSKHSKFIFDYNFINGLHFFSDGTLIFGELDKEKLEKYIKCIEAAGYKVKKIYGSFDADKAFDYEEILRKISEYAYQAYPFKDDLYAEIIPTKEEFVKNLFTPNNVCLTATDKFPPECREYMALFADGQLFLTLENLKDKQGLSTATKLIREKSCVYQKSKRIPADYLAEIYKYAQKNSKQNTQNLKIEELTLEDNTIENLFKNGDCLTFNPFDPLPAWNYAKQMQKEYCQKNHCENAIVKSKHTNLHFSQYNSIQFFSDGTLIFGVLTEEKLEKYIKCIEAAGYKVKKIYGSFDFSKACQHENILKLIKQQAEKVYPYQDEFYVEPLPTKEEFIKELFTKNNICLTATAEFPPECRKYMALFTDGRFLLINKSSLDVDGDISNKATKLLEKNSSIHRETENIPESYLEEIYKQAQKYKWYVTPEEAQQKQPVLQLSAAEKEKMDIFITALIDNNRCLSVTNPDPERTSLSPDYLDYALFADGRLICTKKFYYIEDLQKIFPNLPEIKTEIVPEYYIPEIYKKLATVQKTALEIYLEMMKHKARDLKKMLDIPHHEALELCARITGWSSWKEVTTLSEQQARHNISAEKIKNIIASRNNKSVAQYDYELYVKNHH